MHLAFSGKFLAYCDVDRVQTVQNSVFTVTGCSLHLYFWPFGISVGDASLFHWLFTVQVVTASFNLLAEYISQRVA